MEETGEKGYNRIYRRVTTGFMDGFRGSHTDRCVRCGGTRLNHDTVKVDHEFLSQNESFERIQKAADDLVNHPAHYTDGNIEVWDFIADKKLDYFKGNAVKYISRAGKKDPELENQDLEKAIAYLKKRIKLNKKEKTDGMEQSGSLADMAGTSDGWKSVGDVPLDGPTRPQTIEGDD